MPDELLARLRAPYAEPQPVEPAPTATLENSRARFSRAFRPEPNGLHRPAAT